MAYGKYIADELGFGVIDSIDDGMDSLGVSENAPRNRKRRRRKKINMRSRRKSTKTKRSKRTRRSGKIKHTKTGQPYIILANGRARFIKKRR